MKISKPKIQKKTTPAAATKRPAKRKIPPSAQKQTPQSEVLLGVHNIKPPKGSWKKKKLLGRGSSSGHGKTSTRGSKGQTSRAGRDFYLGFEGGQVPLIRKIPKRGFTSKFKKEYQIVNLETLNRIKENSINPELLAEKGLIKNKEKLVKILGDGELKSAVTIRAHAFSRKAMEKITNCGGTYEVISHA